MGNRYSTPPNQALAEMMRDDLEAQPLRGFAGEMATPHKDSPPPPAPEPLHIPPPDWRAELAEREARERAARPPREPDPPPREDTERYPARPGPQGPRRDTEHRRGPRVAGQPGRRRHREPRMTSATIAGTACQERDIGAHYHHRSGRLTAAESFDWLIPDLPADGVPVDVAHDGQAIGRLVFGELDDDGRLGAVAVIDDGDWLLDYPGDVYYSPQLLVAGPGVRTRAVSIADAAALVSLGLTDSPATVGAAGHHLARRRALERRPLGAGR
jgi:hypothetical protein